jgi:hypothetical protein
LERPETVGDDDSRVGEVPASPNTLKAKALCTALSDALNFVAPASAQVPFLEAVRLDAVDGQLVAAATDRFVLGASRVDYSGEAFTVMIAAGDAKALVKMAKTLKRDEASREITVEVVDAGAQVTFRFNTGEAMTVRGLDVEFPKWRQLLPSDDARMGRIVGMGYNPALVAKFTKVRPDERGDRMVVFPSVTSQGRPGPTAIQIGENFIGLLTPGDSEAYARPGRLDTVAGAAGKVA